MLERRFLIAFVLLAVVVLLNLPLPASLRVRTAARDTVVPFQNGFSLTVHRVSLAFGFLMRAGNAAERERELLERIADLEYKLAQTESISVENTTLRGLLAFAPRRNEHLVLCRVLSKGDTTGFWETLSLDKGRRAGITTNMPVVTADGLVGRTVFVGRDSCDVLLLSARNCKVACKVRAGGPRVHGIARGMGLRLDGARELEFLRPLNPLQWDYLPKDVDLHAGAEVITSGLGGVYPEGLVVGRILAAELHESGLYQTARLVPAVSMRGLEYAFIVMTDTANEADAGPEE